MSFPPSFLDDIRARVGLSGLIQRRTRLVRKGREWSGLCPFHNEKTPSFTVNEDKGFFHCFGCGAHGDVIGFVMRAENRGFVEAVELLAAEAGLQVPKLTPEAREQAARQATLYEVLEAAAAYYRAQLQAAAGGAARFYLERRGLDQAAIARFGLGFAPGGTSLLKQHLLREFPEALVLEAGLLGRREEGGGTFDYFRDRVMFPILDRAGRTIAFGGRVLGDAKPKYLNSPDTPVFHKGRVLYGLSWAREGVRGGSELVVTEGYMDVIALHRAGFGGAVAPLGTALTPEQIEELWRLAPEPILCFDGDAAGRRAAARALDRALPLLRPGRSLRFAALPDGEDPDTLIARYGRTAMERVLQAPVSFAAFLWELEHARRPVDTPERRADLSKRLMARAAEIGDGQLRRDYQSFLRSMTYERLRPVRGKRDRRRPTPQNTLEGAAPPDPAVIRRRRQETLLAIILRYPDLLDELVEDFAAVEFGDTGLDRLRREIMNAHATDADLDAASLKHHLSSRGFTKDVEELSSPRVLGHAKFALSGDRAVTVAGCRQALASMRDDLGAMEEVVTRRSADDLVTLTEHIRALEREFRDRHIAEAEFGISDAER